MTIWTPDISHREGPKYRALADAIAEAVESGDLPEGMRLPTQREIAWRLGVTVGTVTRAYALAQAEGWIGGEVGRGTFVRPPEERAGARRSGQDFPMAAFEIPAVTVERPVGPIVMNQNFPADPAVNGLLAEAMRRLADPRRLEAINGYLSANGLQRHRAAARDWIARFGLERHEDSIVPVNGCQHGLSIAFMALARPGDSILVEALTWPGACQLADLLGLTVATVAIDEEGILPDSFDAACRAHSPRFFYTVPTLHNPTGSILSEERRRAVADIAARHGVYIIEDDVFGYMVEDGPPPIASFAPDLGIYVTSLSKPVAPILRAGFVSAPTDLAPRLAAALRATSLMPSPLNIELACDLIMSGAAASAASHQRRKIAARQKMTLEILGGHMGNQPFRGTHFWLKLPSPWTGEAFAAESLSRGVAVTPGNAFAVEDNRDARHCVRLCIGAEHDDGRIREGLEIISAVLKTRPPAAEAIV